MEGDMYKKNVFLNYLKTCSREYGLSEMPPLERSSICSHAETREADVRVRKIDMC
jgi:hypothetical protein